MNLWTRIERSVDRAVGLVSPRRRAVSLHFDRMQTDPDYRDTFLALMSARGYRAASAGGGAPFVGRNQTADAEIKADLSTLMARARELDRDDPIASGLRRTFESNVIGMGMTPQARTDSPEKNAQLEAYWNRRKDGLAPADDMTHAEWQRMIFGNAWEVGSIFIHAAKDSDDSPVVFEAIEKDRVCTPAGKTGQNIVDGVEKDAHGRPLAYWVAKPGKLGIQAAEYNRVPKDEIVHLRIAGRPGQTHGVPACHAILQDLRDLDHLILASLKRMQVAACLSAFIRTPKLLTDMFAVTAEQYGYKLDQTLEPGMIFKLHPDEEVTSIAPNYPSGEFEPFIRLLARRIGCALGVSWQIVLKDFSESTYSSARTDLLEARQTFIILQHWFRDKLLQWVWRTVMLDGVALGELLGMTAQDIERVYWIPCGWSWIDPESEAAATEIELRLKITTLQEVCASRGKDWEELLKQRLHEERLEADLREEMGLPAAPAAAPAPGAGAWPIRELPMNSASRWTAGG